MFMIIFAVVVFLLSLVGFGVATWNMAQSHTKDFPHDETDDE